MFHIDIRHGIAYFYKDKLYRNASYLVMSNLVISITGFLFWVIAARLYEPSDIGMASVLISMMAFFSIFAVSGFDVTSIRFLPSMDDEEGGKLISTSFLFAIAISLTLSTAFILLIDLFAPSISILKSPIYGLMFIVSSVSFCVFYLLNGMFIARMRSDLVLLKGSLQGALKVIFLPFLIIAGGFGIYLSYALSVIVGLLLSIFLIVRLYSKISLCFDFDVLKKTLVFLSGNYISSIFSQLPNLLFPIIILNMISGADAAYFYMPWHMFFVFFGFIGPINAAFLMEGSYDEKEKEIEMGEVKAIKLCSLVVLGGLVLFLVFGRFILSLFGARYANADNLLYVLAVSLVPAAINQIYLTLKNIRKEMKILTSLNMLIYSSSLVLGTLLIPSFGILGIGYGWFIGQSLGTVWIGLESCRHHIRRRIRA